MTARPRPEAGTQGVATTPLGVKLAQRVSAGGPISVAEFMAACLADPEYGYYARRDPLGRAGDFITAPEISQVFGELIGLWCVAVWEAMGSPSHVVLAELGPGRGTLIADALRAARVRPSFAEAADVALVEINSELRKAQAEALARSAQPRWFDRAQDLPAGPMIVIANEFFDALPIRQFIRTERGWAERVVGLDAAGVLAFGLRPLLGEVNPGAAPIGAIVERRPGVAPIVSHLAQRIARDGGAALVIDYGYVGPAFGDTLQAVRGHQYVDPLANPGEADLTAHVDFTDIADAARSGGASVRRTISQGEFLLALGIAERTAALVRGKDEATAVGLKSAATRLVETDQMGTLFKVASFSSTGLALPAFDDAA